MSEFEQETLSALLDGEADELELRRVLKAMETDPELAQRWERYHLAQSVLHDRGIGVSSSLSQNVAAAIDGEPALAKSPSNTPWQQQLSRIAIAACVAVVAVVALQPDTSQPTAPNMVQNDSSTSSEVATVPTSLVAESAVNAELDPAAQERLREYIEAMSFDPEEPVRMEHIQDSPLFRLVNEYQAQP